ncbi:MAG: 16S rRNA (cytidine(1402)-2'-O)-methyltransferase [Actinomycetota bacterium]|nr:16S rRNA (cytidine(1402)-2'-O)-methyltransferase [Actinomycetota bacterium]
MTEPAGRARPAWPERRGGGRLIVVGTPIGNLGDLSPRAVEVLGRADLIACEDTRRTRQLLSHSGVAGGRRLVAVNDHNEAAEVRRILARLDAGDTVALVSDAGMPGISDPGERVVAAAAAARYEVQVVPGPSAALAALVVSGLPTARFSFEGFLPRRGKVRAQRLADIAAERRTTVLFEAPHRIRETLADLAAACGPTRGVALARELTKVFEDVWRGTLEDAVRHLESHEPRGEYVIVLAGAPPHEEPGDAEVESALRALIDEGTDKRSAIARVASDLDVPKRRVYEVAIRL